jgi:TRAP-type C4-dicarboxylate transport system permease small subunit
MNKPAPLFPRLLVILGGTALVLAMAIDVLAVLGRHTGIPLLGSIELVQMLVAIASSMAVIVATLHGRHAVVRVILARLQGTAATLLMRLDAVALALFVFALAAGSAWIMLEMWGSHEESELWRLPYRPLRLLVVLSLLVTTALVLRKAWQGAAR